MGIRKTEKVKMSQQEIDAQLEAADPGQAAMWPLQWDVQRLQKTGKVMTFIQVLTTLSSLYSIQELTCAP